MRKSISKLIVAGISLLMVLPMSAAPQGLQKASAKHIATPTSTLNAKAEKAPKLATTAKLAPTKIAKKAKSPLSTVRSFMRPDFKIDHQARAPRFAGASTPVYGAIIFSDYEYENGMYSFPTDGASNVGTLVGANPDMILQAGVCVDGLYYAIYMDTFWGYIFGNYHLVFDAETWQLVEFVEMDTADLTNCALDMTYDAKTGNVYGCFYNENLDGFTLSTYDLTTHKATPIAELGEQWNACACAADGTLYAITLSGNLYTVDKTNGNMTFVGATGVEPQYLTSAAIDQRSGRFYWSVCPADECAYMYEINPATGAATLLYQIDGNPEVVGMYVPSPSAEPGAPDMVEDFNADFAAGALNGKLSFTAPTALFDGTEANGVFNYTITANGETINAGTVTPGATVTYDATIAEAGNYKFTAYCSNEAGNGPAAKISMWVGPDAPVAPQNVAIAYVDGNMQITWDAVDTAEHDGYLGDVTYTVTRYCEDEAVVVAEGLTACEFSEAIAEPALGTLNTYYYTVAAVANGNVSAATPSAPYALGSVTTPYDIVFDSEDDFAGFTILDVNEDGRTWSFYGGTASVGYNSTLDMDDWMITPAIYVEEGKQYQFHISCYAGSTTWWERIEVCMGNAPTADAMTTAVIEPTEVRNTEPETLAVYITAPYTGKLYFGVHGISDADQLRLYVNELGVSAGVFTTAPDAPTALKITPDAMGATNAEISFTAPTTSIEGAELTSLDKIEVSRDGQVIATLTTVAPGASYTVTDEVEAEGNYTYSVVAYNESGAGYAASAVAFIGVPVPAATASATVVETENLGEVTISWEAVETSEEGYAMSPSLITYTIVGEEGVVAEDITGTSYTYQAVTEGQDFVYYAVYAVTTSGYSDGTLTNMIAVGEPFTLPYAESFDDAGLSYPMGADNEGGAEWGIADNNMFDDLDDFDGTNGYAYMSGNYLDAWADLFTGKILLDAEAPALSFAYYCINENDVNILFVYVTTADGVRHEVAKVLQNGGAEGEWVPVVIPLTEFAGQSVTITFEGIVEAYVYTMIDAIRVAKLADYDLQATSIAAPAEVQPDEEFTVVAEVLSMGGVTTSDYTVELYRNGNLVASKPGVEIACGQIVSYSFDQVLNVTAPEQNIYEVKVVCEADEDQTNNSIDMPIIVVIPNYPTPTALQATLQSGGVSLTWEEPVMTDMPKVAVTEDFESYEAFTYTNFGEWTLVDEDGLAIGGIEGVNFPGITVGETACAYFILNDSDYADQIEALMAHSGHQYLCSTFIMTGDQQYDWLISPLLSGDSQNISFYAKSFSASYPESFKVLYSTSDMGLDSFVEVDTYTNVPAEWEMYTFHVPAGAKYFAIECVSADRFMFFVDDVTYIPANGADMDLSLVGYNVYRNGEKINDEPLAETNFFDAEGTTSDLYCVTAVYSEGESGPSLVVSVGTDVTGVNDVVRGAANVKVVNHSIVITNAAGNVSVYSADGKAIYSEAAAARNVVSVAPGVYVVKAGKQVSKVIVK